MGPWTVRVLENVAIPDTESPFDTVVAPLTINAPHTSKFENTLRPITKRELEICVSPDILTFEAMDKLFWSRVGPFTQSVLDNVILPLTVTLDPIDTSLRKIVLPFASKPCKKDTFPQTSRFERNVLLSTRRLLRTYNGPYKSTFEYASILPFTYKELFKKVDPITVNVDPTDSVLCKIDMSTTVKDP